MAFYDVTEGAHNRVLIDSLGGIIGDGNGLLVGGTDIGLVYDDVGGTLTINYTGSAMSSGPRS